MKWLLTEVDLDPGRDWVRGSPAPRLRLDAGKLGVSMGVVTKNPLRLPASSLLLGPLLGLSGTTNLLNESRSRSHFERWELS